MTVPVTVADALAAAHRREWAFVLAATVRVASDLDVAEECAQEAYVDALTAWARDGIPQRPGAWLTTTARRRAVDRIRRDVTLRRKLPLLVEPDEAGALGGAARRRRRRASRPCPTTGSGWSSSAATRPWTPRHGSH